MYPPTPDRRQSKTFLTIDQRHRRIQIEGRHGVWTPPLPPPPPLIGFQSNTGPDPWKIKKLQMYEASIQCWFYIGPMVARLLSLLPSSTKKIVIKVGPPLTPRMSTYQKSLETVFLIAICRHSSDKLQSNSLLLTTLSTFVDRINVLDCRLSDEPPSSSCWVCSIESPWRGFTYECPQHAEISLAWP